MSAINLFPTQLIPVSLTEQGPFECGPYIIQYGGSGEYTSFAIIASASQLLIAYTSTHHMAVFHNARAALRYVNPNDHKSVLGEPPYGVVAIYKLGLPYRQ